MGSVRPKSRQMIPLIGLRWLCCLFRISHGSELSVAQDGVSSWESRDEARVNERADEWHCCKGSILWKCSMPSGSEQLALEFIKALKSNKGTPPGGGGSPSTQICRVGLSVVPDENP